MLAHVEQLGQLLRQQGVRVSAAEIADAAAALAHVELGDRRAVRAALAATLIKRSDDRPLFDELFALYFDAAGQRRSVLGDLADALGDAGVDPALARRLLEVLAAEAMSMSAVARMGMGTRGIDVAALIRAAAAAPALDGMSSPLQVGFYSYRMLDALGVDEGQRMAMAALARSAATLGGGAMAARIAEVAGRAIEGRFGALRADVRRHVEAAFATRHVDHRRASRIHALAEAPLARLQPAEIELLRGEVARMARVLRARTAWRRRRSRGRLDLGRTLRRSLATGGVPFAPALRARRPHRPRLVVLCDISDSVGNVSAFMLQLVHALQDVLGRVVSFAFVAEIGEMTSLFAQSEIGRALEAVRRGAIVNTFASSNYGAVLADFARRHMQVISRRTTVVIIGDARGNYNPARADILAAMRRRARQLWWLNPESPALWGFGDSAMREYEPHCDRVVVAYNLESLRRVVDALVL